MPIVSYNTANGKIRSLSSSAGFRQQLLPDASTNVARFASSGADLANRRYKPYGTALSQSGLSGARYEWLGAEGCRNLDISLGTGSLDDHHLSTTLGGIWARSALLRMYRLA